MLSEQKFITFMEANNAFGYGEQWMLAFYADEFDFSFLPEAVLRLCEEDSGVQPLKVRYCEGAFKIKEVLCDTNRFNRKTYKFEMYWAPIEYTEEDYKNLENYWRK